MRAATALARTRGAAAALVAVVLSLSAAAGCAPGSAVTDPPASAPSSPSVSQSGGASVTASPQDPPAQEQSMSQSQIQADRDAITANFQARQQAMVDADTEQLRRLSTPDSHAEHISGYNQPRDEWFDQIESGYFDYHSIDNHSIDVTVTGRRTRLSWPAARSMSPSAARATPGGWSPPPST